jgi:hypothetical protein
LQGLPAWFFEKEAQAIDHATPKGLRNVSAYAKTAFRVGGNMKVAISQMNRNLSLQMAKFSIPLLNSSSGGLLG